MPKDSNTPTGISGDFVLKEGIKPSEALEAMRKGLSLIGCGETCQISYYEAIKDVLGTEKFDILFSANSPTPLKIKFDTPDNPINCLINRTLKPKKIVKGQIIYILNIPDYKIKHLNGEARGFTAICVDDTPEKETFTTLGLPAKGATYAGVNQVLITEFNNPPIGMEVVTEEVATRILQSYTSQELLMVKEYENSQVSTEEFKELEGGKILAVFEFNTKRITQLRNSSLQEARSLFNKWQQ